MVRVSDDSYLTERNSSEVVVRRLRKSSDLPLSRALISAVSHLHEVIRETRPSQAELRKVVEFLTEMGQACDEKRQEWVLLFDVLGVTALVEDINSPRPKGATQNTVRGPFYRADAPHYRDGADISLDGVGEPLIVAGRVVDLDGHPIAGAKVETWQANAAGYYENQQPDLQPEFNLRGIFKTDRDGRFHYRTVKPSGYRVPCDGPAGELLGKVGYPLRRPAHLHFQVSAPDFDTVTTNIFDSEDPHLGEDALFGVKGELIGNFHPAEIDGRPGFKLDFVFVMARSRKNGRPL
jgi:protocatechuate 3,4-dioxygenase beta subunit